jgi:phenylalanyl-tRNA synthetase alpha chain
MLQEQITQYSAEINAFDTSNADELEQFRIRFLGTKGIIKDIFDQFKAVSPEEKRVLGKVLNEFKQLAEAKYASLNEATANSNLKSGFSVAEGPEIEDDWHNFSALNFPEEHPARDMQDTFFIKKGGENGDIALRTHTSSVQVRMMEAGKPPFRALMPGRVYRNEAISARAHCFFHQVEGLYVDENVSFADLKQTLFYFVQELYGEGTKVRFRPSYFPFTEPSAEMDISCTICKGEGCQMCKYSGWVEILGCGMVDPNVLENCGIDSKKYSGFAFGMGIERIANLKFEIKDLRLFSENDVRFLKQYKTVLI